MASNRPSVAPATQLHPAGDQAGIGSAQRHRRPVCLSAQDHNSAGRSILSVWLASERSG